MSNSWDPLNCNPPGSSVHRIVQPRILERAAISFSRDACMYVCTFFWYCAATFKHSLFFFHLYSPFERILSISLLAEGSVHPHKCMEEARSCFKLRRIRHIENSFSQCFGVKERFEGRGGSRCEGRDGMKPSRSHDVTPAHKILCVLTLLLAHLPLPFNGQESTSHWCACFALWVRDQNFVSIYLMKERTYDT